MYLTFCRSTVNKSIIQVKSYTTINLTKFIVFERACKMSFLFFISAFKPHPRPTLRKPPDLKPKIEPCGHLCYRITRVSRKNKKILCKSCC